MTATVTIVGSLADLKLTPRHDLWITIRVTRSADGGTAIASDALPGIAALDPSYTPTAYAGVATIQPDTRGAWSRTLPWEDGAVLEIEIPGYGARYAALGTGIGEIPQDATINWLDLPTDVTPLTPAERTTLEGAIAGIDGKVATATAAAVPGAVADYLAAHPPAGGGVTDHGVLPGLGDDDHVQYHTDARGDERYTLLTDSRLADARTPTGAAGGGLTGTYPNPTVAALRGVTVSATAPTAGQVLTASSGTAAAWTTPSAGAGDATTTAKGVVQLAGDLTGTAAAPTVAKVNGTIPAATGLALLGAATAAAAKTTLTLAKADVGLGSVDNTADAAKPVSTAQQAAINARLAAASNLSDLASAATARANLGLGDAATLSVGTTTGTVAAGNDARITAAAAGRYAGVSAQTGTTYTAVLTDEGKLVTLTNAAAITVTLPTDATAAIPVGGRIDFAVMGAGMATFVAASGATVVGTPSLVTRAQYSTVSAIKTAANAWLVVGDLAG